MAASTHIYSNEAIVSTTNPLPIVSASTSPVYAAGVGFKSSVSCERPDNATPYTAGDVLGIKDAGTPANAGSAILTFTAVGPTGGGKVIIDNVSLEVDVAAVPAGMVDFRLHLYNASPTAILDNAAFDLVTADRTKYLGFVSVPAPIDLTSTLWSETESMGYPVRKQIVVPSGGTVYGQLQTVGGFTPTALAVKVVTIHSVSV